MSSTRAAGARLVRGLGPYMAIAVVVGTVIGSGIFKKPQQVAYYIPEFSIGVLVWVVGGLLAVLGSLAYAEVAVLYPRAGGNYVFLREGYGRLAGFLWGWVDFWMIRAGSLGALATIFAESLHDVLRNDAFQELTGLHLGPNPLGFWAQKALTVSVILALALVNVRGVKWGGVLQLSITLVKIGSLLGIMALPFLAAHWEPAGSADPFSHVVDRQEPVDRLSLGSLTNFLAALVGVLFAYHGWMNITTVAAEVKDPQRNLPLALLGGCGIVIFLYVGANWGYHRVIPPEEMKWMRELTPEDAVAFRAEHGPEAPLPDKTVGIGFCRRLLGPIGAAVAAAAVMFSVFGALNGNLLVGPRLLYAMGEDGLAPRALGQVHARFHTPALAILVLACWTASLVVTVALLPQDKPHFDIMTDFAMFGAMTFETLAVATIFVFRRRFPEAQRTYRCPGYPWVPILYVIILPMVVANMFYKQKLEALVGVGFMTAGALVYLVCLRTPGSTEAQSTTA